MLYPKEDRVNNTLMFSCRTCPFSEPAASSCVFRNNLYNTVGETAGVTQDVGADPTVGLPEFCVCTLCGEEIVCFLCGQAPSTGYVHLVPEDYEEDIMEDLSSIGTSDADESPMRELRDLDEDYNDEGDEMEGVEEVSTHGDEEHTCTISVECL